MHQKHRVHDGAVLHVIAAFIKRFSMSHTPQKEAGSAAISRNKVHHLQMFVARAAVFNSKCVNCLKSAPQLGGYLIIGRWCLCHRGPDWICRISLHFLSPFHPPSRCSFTDNFLS